MTKNESNWEFPDFAEGINRHGERVRLEEDKVKLATRKRKEGRVMAYLVQVVNILLIVMIIIVALAIVSIGLGITGMAAYKLASLL